MGGTVPDELAHEVPGKGNRARMNGTERHPVRCVALRELPEVGEGCMGCGIYEQRPSPAATFRLHRMAATTRARNLVRLCCKSRKWSGGRKPREPFETAMALKGWLHYFDS